MKIYAVIAGLLMAFSSLAADVNITNVTRVDVIPAGSYALGTTGLVTRLLPINLMSVSRATNADSVPISGVATPGTIVTQGFSDALTLSNQFTVDGGIWYSNSVVRIGNTFANPACYWSNNVWQFRNTTGNGTNIFYVDSSTGALLWNTDSLHNIGVSGARPKRLTVSSDITTSGWLIANTAQIDGSSLIIFAGRTALSAPAAGSFRVYDYSIGKDRLYISGPAKQLTDASSVGLLTITCRTNDFVGGSVDWTIYCASAAFADAQAISGTTTYAAVNTNGVWANLSCVENTSSTASSTTTASTLTRAWAMAAAASGGTTNVTISLTADSSLTPAANQIYILWQLRQNSTNNITAL